MAEASFVVPVVEREEEGTGFCGGGVCDDHDKTMMIFIANSSNKRRHSSGFDHHDSMLLVLGNGVSKRTFSLHTA